MFSSIWNADDWATRGGLEKTNWAAAPFVSSYKKFHDVGCKWEDSFPACVATSNEKWWDEPVAWTLNEKQKEDYRWVNSKFMVYNYCSDKSRFSTLPVECSVAPWE